MPNQIQTKSASAVKVPANQTEDVKKELISQGVFLKNFKLIKEGNFIFLPVKYEMGMNFKWEIVEKDFELLENKQDLHAILKAILPINKHLFIPSSFDRIGDCILLKLDPEIIVYRNQICQVILKHFKVDSVYIKTGDVETEYRIIHWECIAGVDNPLIIHKMLGLRWKVDINRVYFNTRLSNEYLRIASLCRNEDLIIDMFAGIGPFSLLCASKSKAKIYALDINPAAIDLLNENLVLNEKHMLGTVKPSCGDSKVLIKSLPKATKIIMNLPGFAIEFLDVAIDHLLENGVIFLHQFVHLAKNEKRGSLEKQKHEISSILAHFNQKTEKIYFWDIQGRILRDVSPSKTHIVWDLTKKVL